MILDVDDFVQWIEKSKAVESWAGAEIGIGNGRFGKSLDHAWRTWTDQSRPSVSGALVTAGRAISTLRAALRVDAEGTIAVQVD